MVDDWSSLEFVGYRANEIRAHASWNKVAEAHALSAAIFSYIQAASPSFPSACWNSEWGN
jgi:hypothetical protein